MATHKSGSGEIQAPISRQVSSCISNQLGTDWGYRARARRARHGSNTGCAVDDPSASIRHGTMKKLSNGLAFAILLGAVGCGGSKAKQVDSGDAGTFVAVDGDFAGFASWFGGQLGNDVLAGNVYPPGTRVGFVNRRVPRGRQALSARHRHRQSDRVSRPTIRSQWHAVRHRQARRRLQRCRRRRLGVLPLARRRRMTPHITSRGLAPADDGFDMDSAELHAGRRGRLLQHLPRPGRVRGRRPPHREAPRARLDPGPPTNSSDGGAAD